MGGFDGGGRGYRGAPLEKLLDLLESGVSEDSLLLSSDFGGVGGSFCDVIVRSGSGLLVGMSVLETGCEMFSVDMIGNV